MGFFVQRMKAKQAICYYGGDTAVQKTDFKFKKPPHSKIDKTE